MLYSVDFVVHLCGKCALHEELVIQIFRRKRLATIALFSYPCVRNSCMYFGTIQLSICEELLCAFYFALLCIDHQHMLCIQ